MKAAFRWITNHAAWYYLLFLLTVPTTLFLNHEWPNSPSIKGQNLAIVLPVGLALASFGFWAYYRAKFRLNRVSVIAFGAWVVLWFVSVTSAFTHGSSWNYTVIVTGLFPLLFMTKPISSSSILKYSDFFAYSLVALVLITEILAFTKGRPAHNAIPVHWGWISDVTGVTERWYGPFGYPSFAGIAGAYLLVYGLARNTRSTLFVAVVGAFMTVFSGQNTAVIGGLIGVLAVWVLSDGHLRFGLRTRARALIASAGVIGVASFALIQNPTLSLRTPLYPIFLDFWESSPLSGVGNTQIVEAAANGAIPQGLTSAHNAYIDIAARYGLLGLVPFLVLLVCAFLLAWNSWRRGSSLSLILIITFAVISLVEFQGDWTYLTVAMSFLFIAISLAASTSSSQSSNVA